MAVSRRWVVLAPGVLWVAPVAEANPDETTIGQGVAWGGNWYDMGDYPDGTAVEIMIADEYAKAYGERTTGLKKQARTRREGVIKGALLEQSITNWAYLLDATADAAVAAGASQKAYQELPFGTKAAVSEYKFGVEGYAKDDAGILQPIRWFFHIGSFRIVSSVAYSKSTAASIGFEIDIYEDDTQATGEELGIYQLVSAAATA